jgi:tRNA(Ile2) C34 agmatinyltransferase TiaS
MSALLTRPHTVRRVREGDCLPRPAVDDGPTLDDVITRAWEVLRADLPAACPVCGGELVPRPSAGSGVVGGRCESCGTSLA